MYCKTKLPRLRFKHILAHALLLFICIQAKANPDRYADSIRLCNAYRLAGQETNTDSAIKLFNSILREAMVIKCDFLIAGCLLKTGENYGRLNNWPQAVIYTKEALPYCRTLYAIADCYEHIGWAYFYTGNYVAAAENYYSALDYVKKSNTSPATESGIYTRLGTVYLRLHENERAIYYLDEGEQIARKNNYSNYVAKILIVKGAYYIATNNPGNAKKSYEEAIAIGKTIARPDLEAEGNEGLGKILIEAGDYETSVHYLQSAINLSTGHDQAAAINASYYLAEAFYHTGNFRRAEDILVQALQKAGRAHFRDDILKGYSILTNVYKAEGHYQKALNCMDSIIAFKDSLTSAEKAQSIDLMEIKYQTAEKNKEIAQKQLLIVQQERDLTHKNTWLVSICSGALLLIFLSVGIYRNTLQKEKLQTQQLRALEQENKISILKAAVQGIDNERSRIARELHDGIGGMLGAAMMRFSVMHHENKEIGNVKAYNEGMDILTEMGDEIRKTAHNLMPKVLLKQDLPDALRSYCSSVEKTGTMDIDLQCYGSFATLTQELKLNLYRIVQELLKNIVAHAQADYALVQLVINDTALTVTVEDNGKGFDTNAVKNGIGLHNLQTRVSSLDGHFTLESEPGKGTSVFIEFEL